MFAKVCFVLCMIYMCLISIIMGKYGDKIIGYFDSKVDSINKIKRSYIPVMIFVLLQSTYIIMIGIIKGLGFQNMAVVWTFIGYFFLGIPMAAFFANDARYVFQW